MFKNLKLHDLIIVILFITFGTIFVYYYINNIERNKILIKLYPLQNFIEKKSLHCSETAPVWLKNIIVETSQAHQAPNNQIAYISPQGQLFHCESGYLGIPLFSKKVNQDTRFRYASVSKLWTSDAVLDLVKQQKIELDTPVLSLLPIRSVPVDQRITQITVKDLLLHRAGFNRTGLMGDEMFRSGQTPFCPTSLEKLAQLQLTFDPNTTFSYSNLGYCLLGEIIANQEVNSYQQVIEKKYALEKSGIHFLKNKRLEDEAKYRYIETSLIGYGDIYTAFDYPALASSAGLSGSARALAAQVRDMIKKPQPNILSQSDTSCDLTKLRDCYGYAMFPYQQNSNSLKVYFRDGTLLGMSSLVVVDDNGGVLTLLSSGQSALGQQQYDQTKMKIYQYLIHQYH